MFKILIFDIRFWTFANWFVQATIFPSATGVEIPRKTCNFLKKSSEVNWHYKIDCSFPERIRSGVNILKVTFVGRSDDTFELNVNVIEDDPGVGETMISGFRITQTNLMANRIFSTVVKIPFSGSVRIRADYFVENSLQKKEAIYFEMKHFTDKVPSLFGVIGVKTAATEEETARGNVEVIPSSTSNEYIVRSSSVSEEEEQMLPQGEQEIRRILVATGPDVLGEVMRFVDQFPNDNSDE